MGQWGWPRHPLCEQQTRSYLCDGCDAECHTGTLTSQHQRMRLMICLDCQMQADELIYSDLERRFMCLPCWEVRGRREREERKAVLNDLWVTCKDGLTDSRRRTDGES